MAQPDAVKKLQAEGWYLKPEPLQSLAQEFLDDDSSSSTAAQQGPSYAELRAALLDCDLRKYGSGCLPEDVNRAHSSSIKGPMVLQVMSVTDVSKPSYATSGSSRLLLLKLHDGRTACKALEHRHCSQLSDTLLPGTKVVLEQAGVRGGVVLLEPKSLRIIGGRVDSLAEAWETQKRYGGTNRPGLAAASGSAAGQGPGPAAPGEAAGARLTSGAAASTAMTADDGASAPKFKQFVPGKDGKRAAAAIGSSSKAGSSAAAAAGKGAAAGMASSSAIAAAAGTTKPNQQKEESVKRTVDVAPVRLIDAATAKQQSAAQAKLLDKLERSQAEAADRGRFGRGGFRGRRGRRRDDDDDEGGGGMTLEEYEAKQKSLKAGLGKAGGTAAAAAAAHAAAAASWEDDEQLRRDEELARQLQAEMDLEEAGYYEQQQQQGRGYAGRGRGQGHGRGGGRPVQYEQQQYRQQQQQQYSHQGQQQHQRGGYRGGGNSAAAGGGVDYTDAMFDQFDYGGGQQQRQQHAGRSGGNSSWGGRGDQRDGRGGFSRGDSGGYRGRGASGGRGGPSSSVGRGGGGSQPGRGDFGRGRGRGR